ncbi:hypothetical protein EJ08DRAFT_644031 [Tothia fuscella]|uniref:PHD-type domain-containing protein n=1 Tax=Tothia fuscella TaxID=1048955 RepID=A0A9P4TRX5_9PEZI|nr:hypothetical protein EJ08DRAFT_644031 [Tothia fuscella]
MLDMATETETEAEVPDTLTTITLEPPADPDGQATVNDFLDYTEYFPSDLIRSLTLIGKLDHDYKNAAARVHDLTTTYGALPTLVASDRPDPQALRTQISIALEQAISFREAAYAEAARLADVAERHSSRLTSIKKKLQALPEPPSRDPTPPPVSPQNIRTRKPEVDRVPRITLHVDGGRKPTTGARQPKHRQILVPGQVLPPRGPENDVFTESEGETAVESADDLVDDATKGRNKVPKTPKPQKLKIVKPPRPRPQGVMGTNVHSSVAGISTSNALAMLTPPPQDAKPGSKHKPWFKLTEFEMAKLRKQMKKNAIWTPSDTMIRRVLTETGRGRDNYDKAKAQSDAAGEPLIDEDPVDPTKATLAPGEVLWNATPGKAEADLINRGMRLNEAKKNKKEQIAKQAAIDAVELQRATQKIENIGQSFTDLFKHNHSTPVSESVISLPASTKKPAKKRKREVDVATVESTSISSVTKEQIPKKLKINHSNIPIAPKPISKSKAVPTPIKTVTTTTTIPLAPAGPSTSPRTAPTRKAKTPTPALSSPTDVIKSPLPTPTALTAAQSRPRRSSIQSKIVETHESDLQKSRDIKAEPARDMRPRSRGNVIAGKAASAEPPASKRTSESSRGLREKRRASVVDAHPVSDPAPVSAAMQPRTTRGGRRPAPGLVTADEDGKGKVSVGKRKAAPKKKGTAPKKENGGKTVTTAEDGWDEVIDPDEPRYCLCGDVSYGTMIACENEDCEIEWFHLACVNLEAIPPRRVKWYCPDCRHKLGIDEKGNVTIPDGGSRRR